MIWKKFYDDPIAGDEVEQFVDIGCIKKDILNGDWRDMLDSIKNNGCHRNPACLPIAIAFHAKWDEIEDASHECWCLISKYDVPRKAFDMLRKFLDCKKMETIEISPQRTMTIIATDCQDEEKADKASELMRYIIDCSNEKRGAFMLSHENEEEADKAIEVYAESFELVNVFQDGCRENGFYSGDGVWHGTDYYGFYSAWRKNKKEN